MATNSFRGVSDILNHQHKTFSVDNLVDSITDYEGNAFLCALVLIQKVNKTVNFQFGRFHGLFHLLGDCLVRFLFEFVDCLFVRLEGSFVMSWLQTSQKLQRICVDWWSAMNKFKRRKV